MSGFDFSSRNSWLPYVDTKDAQKATGIEETAHQSYQLTSPNSSVKMRSMLTRYELGLLYGLARNHYSGRGAIIDAGPLMGATTFSLARGLADNNRVDEDKKRNAIYSFDLFIADSYYSRFLEVAPLTPTLLHEFMRINRDYLDYIVPHQGDFLQWKWPEAPIEILFMDLAKDWNLSDHYIQTMLPRLIPDGVLVQQDYVHFFEYWIHMTMEHFADDFDFCGAMYGATAYFRLKRPLSQKKCMVDLKALSFSKKMELLTRAREKMEPGIQEVMKCAVAMCAVEHKEFKIAQDFLDKVNIEKITVDPVSNFSGIAKSNKAVVQGILDRALQENTPPIEKAKRRFWQRAG